MSKANQSSVSGSSNQSMSQSASRSRRAKASGTSRRTQQVIDREKGSDSLIKVLDPDTKEDRTPLSLLRTATKPTKGGKKPVGESTASGSQYSEADDRSMSRVGESTESDSTTNKSASQSMSEGDDMGMDGVLGMDGESTETGSMDSRQLDSGTKKPGVVKKAMTGEDEDDQDRKPEKKEMTYEEKRAWLAAPCQISLTETPTFFLLDRADAQIAIDSEQAGTVTARNEEYNRLLEMKQANASKYSERSAQTFNNPHKNKETQFAKYESTKQGVGVTTWEIFDTMRRLEEEDDDSDGGPGENVEKTGEEGEGEVGEMDDETNAFLDAMGGDDGDGGDAADVSKSKRNAWMLSPALGHALMIMERMVVQNIWQGEQLLYRNVNLEDPFKAQPNDNEVGSPTRKRRTFEEEQEAKELEEKEERERLAREAEERALEAQQLRVLWRYGCPVVKGQNVTCTAWNRHNEDILAVGYGAYGNNSSNVNKNGYVCCWSLKNPVYPERIFKIENAGVSSVDFSSNHPSLLAVGHADGALALYDVRKAGNAPILKSTVSGGQHTGTIWQCKWVLKGKDRGESLVSIAADGRVTDWSIKKGLECTNLLRLKRVPNKQQGMTQLKGDALLSRQSGGMCVDFNPTERILYLVGTEDGTIHKCSTSYSEQYLETYAGHAGPVYRCKWSPFSSDVFLTCSADWTTKMWRQDILEPVLTFQSLPDAVHDVAWSPSVSTIFGTITSTGRLDIWDITNPIEPRTWMEFEGRSLNCLSFAEQGSPVLCVGDNKGDVTVIKLKGQEYNAPAGDQGTPEYQEERLLRYVKKSLAS
uniref:Dynein axonemal intermediate chain 4 n=1 Tax=Eutreptiella gymnastica TaxID=73025 RepID=A0A7S1NDI3_9EUGL|mmetsp:Transcript_19431/g.34461  ORF Transcript_19431/g.34461 Transcript_19431/m.34461 type:complete len:815 (+) Transcript_19431:127-2571(+)